MTGLVGTASLLRLALRRDRIQLVAWLLAQAAILGGGASSIVDLYDTAEEQNAYAHSTSGSVVSLAFNGPTSGPSLGAIVTVENMAASMLLVSFMTTFMVVRHTRQNEETGRAEMIGAGVVGRYATLAAGVGMAVIADVAFGAVSALVMLGLGLPATGSLSFGAGLALVGFVFAGIAAVTAQVAESARAANGLAAAAVGLGFLLRAVGDGTGTVTRGGVYVDSSWPSYVSPMGWAQQVRP
jgi:ABC-2 type transport system permease protein